MIFTTLRKTARRLGYSLSHYRDADLARRAAIVKRYGIDLLIDVGANTGQYAQVMRSHGYAGRLASFEPVAAAFSELLAVAKTDDAWDVYNCGLGDSPGYAEINVSERNDGSSLLTTSAELVAAAPVMQPVRTERIEVRTLDEVYPTIVGGARRVMLKIDTQGYEMPVLLGGAATLPELTLLQLEMSLAPMYDGETLFPEMMAFLTERGFRLLSLENGFVDPVSRELRQVDGLFVRD